MKNNIDFKSNSKSIKSITWKNVISSDSSILWYREASIAGTNKVLFEYYEDSIKKNIFLIDKTNDIIYTFPKGMISKGYTLAFKILMGLEL